MDDLLQEFLAEVGARAAAFDRAGLERSPQDSERLGELADIFHTIRGTCRFLDLPRIGALASAAERFVGTLRDRSDPARVALATEALARILSILAALEDTGREPSGTDGPLLAALAGGPAAPAAAESGPESAAMTVPEVRAELAVQADSEAPLPVAALPAETGALANQLAALVHARNQLAHHVNRPYRAEVASALERLTSAIGGLRHEVAQLRRARFDLCWPALVQAAADVATDQGRQVDFRLVGGDVAVESDLLLALQEPVGRVMAHAAGKAVEDADTRRAAGKPARAVVQVSVERDGRMVVVTIADDGAGRGLGREVDTSALLALGGTREVAATRAQGTTVRLRIPLPRTVEPVLVLHCADLPFALPQVHVRELLAPPHDGTARVEAVGEGGFDLLLQARRLPLVSLGPLIADRFAVGMPTAVAILELGSFAFALAVDFVADAQDVVVTPLSPLLRGIPFLTGAAVLGDGRTALVLDVDGLAATVPQVENRRTPMLRASEGAVGTGLHLLRFLTEDVVAMAIPIERLARLEDMQPSQLEDRDGRPMLRSPGGLIPLLALDGSHRIGAGVRPVLILSVPDHPVGLVVDRVLDIQQCPFDRIATDIRPGILGSAVLGGCRTEIVDVDYFAALA